MFYPKWWLKLTGYFLKEPASGKDVIMFSPTPEMGPAEVQAAKDLYKQEHPKAGLSREDEKEQYDSDYSHSSSTVLVALFCFSAASLYAGYYWGRKHGICETGASSTVDGNVALAPAGEDENPSTPYSSRGYQKHMQFLGQIPQKMVSASRGYAPIAETEA
jgi:hypothetical protein